MGENEESIFETLRGLGIDDIPNHAALERIGYLIDLSGDLRREEGTARALEWCDLLEGHNLSNEEAILLEYFQANAWGNRERQAHAQRSAAWAWEQPELQKQILHLRRAINHKGFDQFDEIRRCQIYTNLGNSLSTIGRFVEALEYWDRALALRPNFGMALGNRGCGLAKYATTLYDSSHQRVFCLFAHKNLSAALSDEAFYNDPGYESARSCFRQKRDWIDSVVDVEEISRNIKYTGCGLDTSDEERRYRQWCLQNRLFLNPLNDLGPYAIGGRDTLQLPSFVTPLDEPPISLDFSIR